MKRRIDWLAVVVLSLAVIMMIVIMVLYNIANN